MKSKTHIFVVRGKIPASKKIEQIIDRDGILHHVIHPMHISRIMLFELQTIKPSMVITIFRIIKNKFEHHCAIGHVYLMNKKIYSL